MMRYEDFRRLIMDAAECETLEQYMAEVGGSVPESVPDDALVDLLAHCYTYGRARSVAAARHLTGLSQVAFAQAYGLPARSVANWESHGRSSRTAPQYVVDLLAYAVIVGGE